MSAERVFSGAVAATVRCVVDEPLVPPSPYKPGTHRVRSRSSTLPSLFASKLAIMTAQDRDAANDREAVRQVESMMVRRKAPTSRCAAIAEPQDLPNVTVDLALITTMTESMQMALFFSIKCRQTEDEECEAREGLKSAEEHAMLQLENAFLSGRQEHLAETLGAEKAEQLAMLVEERRARQLARDSTLRLIEAEVVHASMQRRRGEALRKQIEALLPEYLTERAAIEDAEAEDLRTLFEWHAKNRPLGPGCFIKGPEEDPRIRHGALRKPRNGTAEQAERIASAKARSLLYRERLRDRTSTLVAVAGDTESEMVYAEEGRLQLQSEKTRLHEHIRRTRALEYLIEEEQDERMQIQHEEASAYQPIAAFGVDHLYAIRAVMHEQSMLKLRTGQPVCGQDEEDEQALRAAIREQLAQEAVEAAKAAEAEAVDSEPLAMEAPAHTA